MRFSAKFEELYQAGASDFEASKFLAQEYKAYKNSLNELSSQPIPRELIFRHVREIEEFIVSIYKYVLRDMFADYLPTINSIPISFIALGSFGREEISIYSDIDIMVVYKELKGFNPKEIIERVIYLLWDAGIKIGHRVHEVNELYSASQSDQTIKTAMIEGRFFYGSRFLFTEAQKELNRVRKSEQKEYFSAKLLEQKERYKRYPISVEPNLKEGVGALRDANMLFWVLNSFYFVNKIRDLSGVLFSESEYQRFQASLDFILRTRLTLHLLSGKKNDHLTFDFQRECALSLGFKDTNIKRAESAFMYRLFGAFRDVALFSNIFIHKEINRLYKIDFRELKKSRVTKNIFHIENSIFCSRHFKEPTIESLLTFILSIKEKVSFDFSFLNFIKSAKKIRSKKAKKLTFELFKKDDCDEILELFLSTQMLEVLFPQLLKIINLSQFDGYHKYPVDAHLIECVHFLQNPKDELAEKIFLGFDKDERAFIKLVAFLHDSGKGRKLDHSDVGAKIFRSSAKEFGLKDEFIERGALLIKHHILMSDTALKDDIYSERAVLKFISEIKDAKNLDFLYVLTVADITATNESLYSKFSSRLLRELYYKAKNGFDKGELISQTAQRLKKERVLKNSDEFLSLPPLLQKNILRINSHLFFVKHTTKEILGLSKMANECVGYSFFVENESHFVMHIMMKQELNLGWLLGRLAFLNLVSMDIFRLFDGAKYFRLEFEEKMEDEDVFELDALLQKSLDMSKRAELKVQIDKKEITLDDDHSDEYAIMRLHCKDQKGLMAYIIDIFDELKIDIATAKVMTVRGFARDLFLIEKSEQFIKNRDELLRKIVC